MFVKGKSGNPGGRPKADGTLRDLAREASPRMLAILIAIAEDEEKAAPARVTAASSVIDRGYGKPTQTLGDSDGNPLEWIDVIKAAQQRANAE